MTARRLGCILLLFAAANIYAQEPGISAPPPEAEASAAVPPPGFEQGLTLMVMIREGGVILWVIMGLGFAALVLSLYLLLTVSSRREVPKSLVKRARSQIHDGEVREAYQMCEDRGELLANVLRAGLQRAGHDRFVIQEAMESEGERGSTALWQRISYLNNIAVIAPLLGLLGTVWGMMQAINAIVETEAQVRQLTMAYSVTQAMVTTAAGLIVAIPAMTVYFLLRGRAIKIVAEVEALSSDFVEMIVEAEKP